jgi:hypothetical protein
MGLVIFGVEVIGEEHECLNDDKTIGNVEQLFLLE